jgi:hypothetical protein
MAAYSDNKLKPGVIVDKDVWSEFKDRTRGESSHVVEDFMKEYRPTVESKVRPHIVVDKDIWTDFKSKFGANASKVIEAMMKANIENRDVSILSSETVGSLTIQDPAKWSISYCSDSLNLTNVSCSVNTTGTTQSSSYSSGDDSAQIKNIFIK